jgi:serine protease Do
MGESTFQRTRSVLSPHGQTRGSKRMKTLVQGQRIDLGTSDVVSFDLSGMTDRSAVAAVLKNGSIVPLERDGSTRWILKEAHLLPDDAEIVGYTIDERDDVVFADLYPISMGIGADVHELPRPQKRLGLVILAEIYDKGGRRRIRIGGDGYSYGVEAYARAKGIDPKTMPCRTTGQERNGSGSGARHAESPGPVRSGQLSGSGSGILVAPRTVVTNAHVVENGTAFLSGPRRIPLELLAVDPVHDLAVLRGDVDGERLRLTPVGGTWLGQSVIAAGYPLMDLLGSDLKVTMGNVSGLVGAHGDVSRLQFTAPIGSGSSGGAVTDEFGNLVGVTSASLAHGHLRDLGAVSENMNFAIKSSMVVEILSSLGVEVPAEEAWTDGGRREAVARLRAAVMSIGVVG